MLSTRAVARSKNKETKRHPVIIHNSKAELRFLRCFIVKEGGRIQSGRSSFPFRFDQVRDVDTGCETLTCHVHARRYSTVFSATSLSTRVVERTKRHNNGTILSQKMRADRHHELPSVWVSIVCEAQIAKLPPVTCMRMCYSVQRRCLQGRSGSRPPCSCECSANATQGLVSCMTLCKNIPPPPPQKKKETRPGLI